MNDTALENANAPAAIRGDGGGRIDVTTEDIIAENAPGVKGWARLRAWLHRGGAFGYWWTKEEPQGGEEPEKRTVWYPVDAPAPVPTDPVHVYFGVHPTTTRKGAKQRAKIDDIAAVNCLFADFDAKHYAGGKREAWSAIFALPARPSVVIDTGGGYHVYWLFPDPWVIVTEDDRKRARELQAAWVAFVGGDPGAKDIAHVLRVPGTRNMKAAYGPDFPRVRIVFSGDGDAIAQYSPDALASFLPAPAPQLETPASAHKAPTPAAGIGPRERGIAEAALAGELGKVRAAREGERNDTLNKAAFALGQIVGAGWTTRVGVEDALMDAARACGLPGKEAERTIASGLDAGAKDPRELPPDDPAPQQTPASAHRAPTPAERETGAPPEVVCGTWAGMAESLGPISWAWGGWLANGQLHILAAQSGLGKSALALRLLACWLLGLAWPDGTPFDGERGRVLWCEAEAAQAVNLERARSWGLPLDYILSPFADPLTDLDIDLTEHRERVRTAMLRDDVRIAVVDSLRGARKGDENASEGIDALKFLAELARDSGKPVLLTHHLRKRGILDAGEGVTLDRLRGSSAITQLARVIWALDAPDPADPQTRRLSVIKNNLGRFPDPIGLQIGPAGVSFMGAPEAPHTETEQQKAGRVLRGLLTHAPMLATEIQAEIEQQGLSWDAAKRAKQKMGVLSVKTARGWEWSLPLAAE